MRLIEAHKCDNRQPTTLSFQVSSFKFQVSSFKFQVSSFKFQVSSFKFQVSSFRFQVSSFKFQVSSFRFQVSSLPHMGFFYRKSINFGPFRVNLSKVRRRLFPRAVGRVAERRQSMSTLYAILPCIWPVSSSIRNTGFNMDVVPFHIARYRL